MPHPVAWHQSGLTITASRTWVTLRMFSARLAHLHGDRLLQYLDLLATGLKDESECRSGPERHMPLDEPGLFISARPGKTSVSSSRVTSLPLDRHLVADQLAWLTGAQETDFDDRSAFHLLGNTLELMGGEGLTMAELPVKTLEELPALLRQGASCTSCDSELYTQCAAIRLRTEPDSTLTALHITTKEVWGRFSLGKSSLLWLATEIEQRHKENTH